MRSEPRTARASTRAQRPSPTMPAFTLRVAIDASSCRAARNARLSYDRMTNMAAVLTPPRRSLAPLRTQVLEELRQAVIAGKLAPGSRLIERELIDMLGVSRTVVREALRQLQSEGLVAEDAKKGLVVRALTETEARHLYAIRALLEGLAARLFVENADEPQVRRLADSLQKTVDAYARGDPRRILRTKT